MVLNSLNRLLKRASLEKTIEGHIINSKGDLLNQDIEQMDDPVLGNIRKIMVIRAHNPLPVRILNNIIDDGMPSLMSYIDKYRLGLTPGEALYLSIGKKDNTIFNSVKSLNLNDILGLIEQKLNDIPIHKIMNAPQCPLEPIEEYSMPKHIKVTVIARSMSPSLLMKQASKHKDYKATIEGFRFEFVNGEEDFKPKRFIEHHIDNIQDMIDEGVIVKVVQILGNGKEKVLLDKTASSIDEDYLYAFMTSFF